ncbi:MAG: DNA translocase FtsK [Parcubacteria group bacterium]|nr:DNA translocase FtsK [Parcubacteria group bacterium]
MHKKKDFPEVRPHLAPEIKNNILAVLFLALALILFLSSWNLAGPLGRFIFRIFDYLLGWGYFILPILLIILAFNFFRSWTEKINFNKITVLGAFLVLFASLSILELISSDTGGLLGEIGAYLKNFLGLWASLIIYSAFLISGLLIIFNTPLKLPKISFKKKQEIMVNAPQEIMPPATEPVINEPKFATEEAKSKESAEVIREEKKKNYLAFKVKGNYNIPPLDLLDSGSSKPTVGDLKANANIIKRTLENFGIVVEMGEINVGPTVTQYTLKPTEGVKLSSITSLQNDLALALAAHPLRIEAPIPGKSLVGIEVPNKAVALVRLGNLLKEINFQKETPALAFALGRDVEGKVMLADLSTMPHLLIAGATGSGKSVCIHSIISSFLFKNSPSSLRLILVDPKRVELARYNGIPHLLTPVITDNKKVLPALRWVINEMNRRYDLLSEYQARDIEGYNLKALARKEDILPYLVVIIDELADLMIYYGRDLESFIIRIAQMARATGIHLIVSTQRPSVEVITGLIKANITARIAFQVASQVDSRTILDMAGAEKLLGHGDMLFLSPESSKPRRIQGAFLSEAEIDKLVEWINKNSQTVETNGLANEFKEFVAESASGEQIDLESLEENEDELYPEAYDIVVKAGKASASLLQRRLKIGYARAARLLDLLEARGIVGPVDGAKPREVFVKDTNSDNN